jgi:hypothetical protein
MLKGGVGSSWGRVLSVLCVSGLVPRRAGSSNTLRSLGGSAKASGMMVRLVRRGAQMLTSVFGEPALGVGRGRLRVALCLLLVMAAWGGAGHAADETATKPTGSGLATREQELAQQFRDLEKTFLRLADLLAPSDPRRAALLRSVFEQARDAEMGDRLDTIVQLLEKGQLLKAGASQSNALDTLRELLTLLDIGDALVQYRL